LAGQVRLVGEIRDYAGEWHRDSLLCEVHGVEVYLYSDGELLDSSTTDYGTYGWFVERNGIYTAKAWAVPTVAESVGPVTCGRYSCDAPDTLVLGRHGLIVVFPNPFVAAATISFYLHSPAPALLTVSNVTGQRVKTISEGTLPAGELTVQWDGTDDQGTRLPSGPYWIILHTGEDYSCVLAFVGDDV